MRRTFALALLAAAGCSGDGGGGPAGCPDPAVSLTNERAMLFEGGRIEIDGSALTSYEDATLEAWVRMDDAGQDSLIASKGEPGETPRFVVFAASGQDPAAGFADGASLDTSIAIAGDIPLGTWTHLAVAWNTSALTFYVNGSVVVNTTTVTGPPVSTDAPMWIGGDLSETMDPIGGAIDEVRLWAGARDAGQILADYDTMLTGAEPGLLAAWNFEESGKRIADLTPAASCGTIKGEASRTSETPF